MKSPFAIFRKHQKVAMAVLGILVMFAFVIGDALQDLSSSGGLPSSLRAIMFAVFGAVLLGGIGYTSGRVKEFAMTGFILGAVLGVVVLWYFRPLLAVESKAGNLTEQELRELVERKRIANQFLIAALDSTLSDIERQLLNNPQFAQFIEQQRQQRIAPFYFQDATTEANVLQTFLMSHEAEQMGITVSNETINDYLRALTQQPDRNDSTKTNWLTPKQFHEILKTMRLSEKDLFDTLREEIKAKMAMELIAPPNLTTPDQYWQSYQKLNVKQELDAVALDVKAFTADIPDPSEGELTAFFSQSRDVFPNQNGPGKPGFRQPRRLTLEYLEADYASAEEEVLQSIEKDLLTSEDRVTELENERLRIKNAIEEVDKNIQDGTIKKEDESEEKDLARQSEIIKLLENGQEINKFDFEIAKDYEDNKNFRYRNRLIPDDFLDTNNFFDDNSFTPESETSSDENQSEKTQDDSESEDNQPVSAQKPKNDQQKQDSSPENPSESGNSESPSSESKNPSEQKNEKSESGSALLDTELSLFQVATFLDDADEPDTKQNTTQNDSSKSGEEQKTPAATGEAVDISAARGGPAPPPLPESPARRGPAPPPLPEDPLPPLPRYRPLDAELKNEIREELIDQETTKIVDKRVADAMGFMRDLEDKYQEKLDRLRGISREDDDEKLDKNQAEQLRSEIASNLVDYVSENSLVYGETESLSYAEFLEPENQERYSIASAGIPNSNSFTRITIIDRIFSNNSSNSEEYSASQAEADSGNQFAYWKTEDVESFIPKSLDEPGIREQVLHAWKMEEARKNVQKRAEKLAEIVRNSETEMSEALKEESLTGKEGDINTLTVQPTESFSWLETGLQDPSDPFGQQQTAQIWDIITIEKAGNDFMKFVFEDLQNGEVGVAPNFDHSIYYVVKVKNRSTSVPGSLGALKQGFRTERFNNIIYYSLNLQNQQTTAENWSRRFYEETYNLQRNTAEANR